MFCFVFVLNWTKLGGTFSTSLLELPIQFRDLRNNQKSLALGLYCLYRFKHIVCLGPACLDPVNKVMFMFLTIWGEVAADLKRNLGEIIPINRPELPIQLRDQTDADFGPNLGLFSTAVSVCVCTTYPAAG